MPLAERMRQWDEQLIEQGRQKGREEGREEGEAIGVQKGRAEGEAEVLLRLLEKKFGPLDEATVARVRNAGSEKLLLWAERILTAETIDEVLA